MLLLCLAILPSKTQLTALQCGLLVSVSSRFCPSMLMILALLCLCHLSHHHIYLPETHCTMRESFVTAPSIQLRRLELRSRADHMITGKPSSQ